MENCAGFRRRFTERGPYFRRDENVAKKVIKIVEAVCESIAIKIGADDVSMNRWRCLNTEVTLISEGGAFVA